MVTITPEAIAKAEQFISAAGAEPMDWFLVISWRRGAGDNRRTADGAVTWERTPDEGWVAELSGWKPNKVPLNEGMPLYGNVRLLVQDHYAPGRFPGGEVYVEENEIKVKAHAI